MSGKGRKQNDPYFYSMKTMLKISALFCLLLIAYSGWSQSKTTTIVIFRHAEKDTSTNVAPSMRADPLLSEIGMARAERLVAELKDFKPDAIFSTTYNRTKHTVWPLSKKSGVEIQFYNPQNQKAFADQLKTMEGQTIVVVGHSNTAPRLVNLLTGTEKYPDLADSVYDQYYVVRITNGNVDVEIKKY